MSTAEIHQGCNEHDTRAGSSQEVIQTEPSHQVLNSVLQEYHPGSYIYEVHAALEELKRKDAAGVSNSLIWTVPDKYRNNDAEHYNPVSWRFGLHNCPDDSRLNNVTEGFKIKVAGALQLSGKLWNRFCEEVVKEPKEHWDAVYGSLHTVATDRLARSFSIEKIRCLLSLDALFLVVFLQTHALERTFDRSTPGKYPTLKGIEEETIRVGQAVDLVMKNPVLEIYKDTLWHDIWLVGNQIPIELQQRAVGILSPRKRHEILVDVIMPAWEHDDWRVRNILHLCSLCILCVPWNFFYGPSIETLKKDDPLQKRMEGALRHPDSCHGIHILDSVYCILRGHKSIQGSHFYYYRNVPSASYLEACGVTIRGKDFTCFEDISFENGVPKVPFLRVQHGIEGFLRNLIVHERLTVEKVKPRTSTNSTEPEKTATTEHRTPADTIEDEAPRGWTCLKSPILRAFRRESEVGSEAALSLSMQNGRRQIRNFSVSCYTTFMESLMKTPEDVDLLAKQGVFSRCSLFLQNCEVIA